MTKKRKRGQAINLILPGLMADTGMIRWPINFPPSSKAAILREARVGRITCQLTVSVNSFLTSPPTAAIITVLSDSPFWRQLAPRPTLGWWHYCSGRSWSSVLFFWCLQEVRTFLPLHTRPPAAQSETDLKSPDTHIKRVQRSIWQHGTAQYPLRCQLDTMVSITGT